MDPRLARFLRLIAVVFVYFLAAQLGLSLNFRGTNISPVWPPTGIAFAAVFLFGYEIWPAIAVSAFLANLLNLPVLTSLGIATGNTLEALSGVYFLRRFGGSSRFLEHSREASLFLLLSVLASTAISATIGTLTIFLSGLQHGASFGYLWYTWWLGDSVGNIIFAPMILAWIQNNRIAWTRPKIVEGIVLLIMIAFTGEVVFDSSFSVGGSLPYLTIPLILVSTFRFEQLGAVSAVFLLSTLATLGSIHGHGPFQGSNRNESLIFLQTFMGVIAATALLLAAVLSESRKAKDVLRSSLNEKEILLREIHHRVKNNLQVISSLLSLQSRSLNDEKMKKVFEESGNRIKAMALIHERLYSTDDLSTIQFADYAKQLAKDLFQAFGLHAENIRLSVKAEDVELNIDQAIPLGLIMSELISNSCKYAFPDGRVGEIVVGLVAGNPLELFVKDNGVGLPANFRWEHAETLGLRLVKILSQQLRGNVTVESDHGGTVFHLKFPIQDARSS